MALSILLVFSLTLIGMMLYLAEASLLSMIINFLVIQAVLSWSDKSRTANIYLFNFASTTVLFIVAMLNVKYSYLYTESFYPFYRKALLLETIFWGVFGLITLCRNNDLSSWYRGNRVAFFGLGKNWFFSTSILLNVAEIAISHTYFFKPYTEFTDSGTIAFEVACLFCALAVFLKKDGKEFKPSFLEIIATPLSLLISIAIGKRLPLAYIIFSYVTHISKRFGKASALLVLYIIVLAGFFYGIFRDFMSYETIDTELVRSSLSSTNQGAILHAAAVYLRVIAENKVEMISRLFSFFGNFLFSFFLPLTSLPEVVRLNTFIQQFYPIQGNGGLIGVYSFFFFGSVGLVVVPVIFGFCLSGKKRLELMRIISACVLLTSPRWVLYNVGPIMRLISYTLFLLMVLRLCRAAVQTLTVGRCEFERRNDSGISQFHEPSLELK